MNKWLPWVLCSIASIVAIYFWWQIENINSPNKPVIITDFSLQQPALTKIKPNKPIKVNSNNNLEKKALNYLKNNQFTNFSILLKNNPNLVNNRKIALALVDITANQKLTSAIITLLNLFINKSSFISINAYFKAIANYYSKNYKPAIEQLLILNSYIQDELPVGHINNMINKIQQQFISELFKIKNLNSILDLYDLFIRFDGRNIDKYQYLKAKAAYDLDAVNLSLELLNSNQYNQPAQELYRQIKSTIAKQEVTEYELDIANNQVFIEVFVAKGYKVKLLIDTGASLSAISKQVANKLNPRIISQININTAGGLIMAPLVVLNNFGLPQKIVSNLRVAVLDLDGSLKSSGLLGMDYLGKYVFYIDPIASKLYIKN